VQIADDFSSQGFLRGIANRIVRCTFKIAEYVLCFIPMSSTRIAEEPTQSSYSKCNIGLCTNGSVHKSSNETHIWDICHVPLLLFSGWAVILRETDTRQERCACRFYVLQVELFEQLVYVCSLQEID